MTRRFDVDVDAVCALFGMTAAQRLTRAFTGYEVAIVLHLTSAAMLFCSSALLAFVIFAWRSNARFQARLWTYVAALERGKAP